ncbi:MAG: MBL fold metallo-hydrolase [Endozoicomonas sp. (ex Botrylloides leachii)]|nr:MBL fold metallo-hydrolase [Endozoicomonas sp. (ex Botrylloides leachii)]
MILRQLLHKESSTYTYVIADSNTREACIIDPVKDNIKQYLQLFQELGIHLQYALDTHIHADHITALGALEAMTKCKTMMGSEGDVPCASEGFQDGKQLSIGSITLHALFTPGHTADSYCFFLKQKNHSYLFSGDTLLIRGTGRTDFQNGDPAALYNSIHNKIMALPSETILLPGHDYKGWTSSTLIEEKKYNPRLQFNKSAFINHMNNLNLPDPKMMAIAVPANLACGKQKES